MSHFKNDDYDSWHILTIKNIGWGVYGSILGIIINNIVIYLSNIYKIKSLKIQIIIQIFLCSIVLALIEHNFRYFGWTWQNTTPGFVFVSFFFGVQFRIMTNIQQTYIMKD